MPAIKKLSFLLLIAAIAAFARCKEDPPPPDEGGLKITGVSIPASLNVPAGGEITITGSGFAVSDQIMFVTDAGKVYTARATSVTGAGASFRSSKKKSEGRCPLGRFTNNKVCLDDYCLRRHKITFVFNLLKQKLCSGLPHFDSPVVNSCQ